MMASSAALPLEHPTFLPPHMTSQICFQVTLSNGVVVPQRAHVRKLDLSLLNMTLVHVSDEVAQLTRVVSLALSFNRLAELPTGVLGMTRLTNLNLFRNRLTSVDGIGRLTALTQLMLGDNRLVSLPREIGQLRALERLDAYANRLTSLPSEIGRLRSLRELYVMNNHLTWLPSTFDRLPASATIQVDGNPLPIEVNGRADLPDLFAATTSLAMIRDDATTIAIGLQELELPALVTLEIVDAAFANAIPMHLKWSLITRVKHFRR